MNDTSVVLTLKRGRSVTKTEGTRVVFSPHQWLTKSGNDAFPCLVTLANHLKTLPGLAVCGSGALLEQLLKVSPDLAGHFVGLIAFKNFGTSQKESGLRVISADDIPEEVKSIFLCETLTISRLRMRQSLPKNFQFIEPTVLAEIATELIPENSWVPLPPNIYPIDIPQVSIRRGLDLVLMDCPSRNLSLMPNGLAYVSNALKKSAVSYQICDLDIISYHEFHVYRLFDCGGRITLPSGRALPEDPWQAEHYDVWSLGSETVNSRDGRNEVLDFFSPIIDAAITAVVEARPKVLGLSIQQCNEAISREVVRGIKAQYPEIIILVGGFSCYNADIGRRAFPECDYMCIGEADLTVGPLVEALAHGERPFNQPGILSRYDTPDYKFIPAPMVHNLDQIEFPKYEWADLTLYRNFNDYQLTPIIASRGCRWSRCTFCAERFYWRIRSPENFVDELEWLVGQGCHLFMFNESDLNGMPERVIEICDEIIRRGLHKKVKLTGQLRIHKKSNRQFFEKLRAANFVALRFGVDAFSENTLRLQKKGYTVDMVSQNLRDCWEVGIYTEVNWVIGVPGETHDDVEEGIQLILKNQQYIGRLANINPLILVNGSVYWIDPASHNIVFREPKEDLYAKFPRALPADAWYSTEPYIDAQVRKERFEYIVVTLHDAGFPVGAWANRIIEDVKLARDPNRAGAGKTVQDGEYAAVQKGGKGEKSFRKVIPIQAHETTDEVDKPPAEPPLFKHLGDPPKLLHDLETHTILFYDGWYYGVPHAIGKVDITNLDTSKMSGIVRHSTEQGVIEVIEEASHWANTRGQYDAQEKQRKGGSYMRADSALGESSLNSIPDRLRIIRYDGQYIAVSQRNLREAFATTRFGLREDKAERVEFEARSPMRKLASRLPPSIQQEIRRLIRLQSFERGESFTPLITKPDYSLISMLWQGAIREYIKAPLNRLLSTSPLAHAQERDAVAITGENCSVISVTTKNALPELMWTIENYNLVKFDGKFYGIPHGTRIDWENADTDDLSGVFVSKTIRDVVQCIETVTGKPVMNLASSANVAFKAITPVVESVATQKLLGSIDGYNVVSYEGWIYGIPQSAGPIDLTETDVMGMEGVIRDVSRDVVENEILELVKTKQLGVA